MTKAVLAFLGLLLSGCTMNLAPDTPTRTAIADLTVRISSLEARANQSDSNFRAIIQEMQSKTNPTSPPK